MSKLQALRRVSPEDMAGAPDWFVDRFLPFQNDYNEQIYNQVSGGLSATNTVDRYKEVDLDHGVQTRVSIPRDMKAPVIGVTPVRCIGVELDAGKRPTRKLYALGMPRIDWSISQARNIVLVTATFPTGSTLRGRVNLKFLGG